VAPAEVLRALQEQVDQTVCLATPEPFRAIAKHYHDFRPCSDDEVLQSLEALARVQAGSPSDCSPCSRP
jgi:putative phosphoribosyl transferase